MKILAVADIHGAYAETEKILEKETGYSAILVAGDITTNGTQAEAEKALKGFRKSGKPLYAVTGNMDPPHLEDTLSALDVNINAKGVMLDDVGLFGVSASPFTPLHTPNEVSEEEIAFRAHAGWKDIQAARIKIFVPHAPPRDTKVDRIMLGKHVGSTAVRKFIEQCQPNLVVCGHIHEARGMDSIGSSLIVNCGPVKKGYYAVITVGKEVSVEMKG